MALVNPQIAMSYRPTTEYQPRNALAEYAQIQQIVGAQEQQQLNALKMQEAKAALDERNALRQLDPNSPDYEAQLFRVNPTTGIAYRRELAAAAASRAAQRKSEIETTAAKQGMLGQAYRDISQRPSDANITAHMEDVLASDIFGDAEKNQVRSRAQQLLAMPYAERVSFLASQGAKASELKPQVMAQGTGGATRLLSVPAFGGAAAVVPGSEATMTVTPGEVLGAETTRRGQDITSETSRRGQDITAQTAATGQAITRRGQDITAATARRGQDIQRELSLKPTFNAQAGGFVVPPSAAAPQGAFIPLSGISETKDQKNAVAALKSAGYDPETGKDRIEELIGKSTGGLAGATIDTVAAFFNKTTEGRAAIGSLASRANQIALDMAGGKLGAGISNADRDFIVSTLGDVANPLKPVGERLAAWREARARMLTSGLVPPPKAPEKAPAGGATGGNLSPAEQAELDQLRARFGKNKP